MAFWICCILGVLVGTIRYGTRALQHARENRFDEATGALQKGAILSGVIALFLTVVFLGWPFQSKTISVTEEVTRTVMETVEVPVLITYWFFFSAIEMRPQEVPREVTESIIRERLGRSFSPLLLVPMAIVGISASTMYLYGIHWFWRWRG